MNGRSTALILAGLLGFGLFAADVGARSQGATTDERWMIDAGGGGDVWKLNTRTGELYYCIPAQAHPKVVCSK